MPWVGVSDGPEVQATRDRDGSVSVASMTIDGTRSNCRVSIVSEDKPGRAIVTIDGSRRVAHVASPATRGGYTWRGA